MAHPKHHFVRRRDGFCCGCCGVSETDSGGELTIDHFRPVSKNGDDSDDNLVCCCLRCNLNKGDLFPEPDDLARGRRLLHPLLDADDYFDSVRGLLTKIGVIKREAVKRPFDSIESDVTRIVKPEPMGVK